MRRERRLVNSTGMKAPAADDLRATEGYRLGSKGLECEGCGGRARMGRGDGLAIGARTDVTMVSRHHDLGGALDGLERVD